MQPLSWGETSMTEEDLAKDLERRFHFVEGSIKSVIEKCVQRGIKHDQLNKILTYIILNRQPCPKSTDI
jgi:DNA-binding transcriptional regulator YhcF (GntR family)